MIRDFSTMARNELIDLVHRVEDEQWLGITDSIGDWMESISSQGIYLNIWSLILNEGNYHKKVIDKYDATINDITTIFVNVNSVSRQYRTRFAALLADLQVFKSTLKVIADVLKPSNESFNVNYIGTDLKGRIKEYLVTRSWLNEIIGDGISQKELVQMDKECLIKLLDLLSTPILNNFPSIGVGEKVEIPIGPGVVMYYQISDEIRGNSNNELNIMLDEQKGDLLELDFKYDWGEGVSTVVNSEYGTGVCIEDSRNETYVTDMGCFWSEEYCEGSKTYGYTHGFFYWGECLVEKYVINHLESSDVKSALGIRFSNIATWTPLPEPVLNKKTDMWSFPNYEVEWEMMENVAGAGITLLLGKKLLGLILAPLTNGTSLVFTVT